MQLMQTAPSAQPWQAMSSAQAAPSAQAAHAARPTPPGSVLRRQMRAAGFTLLELLVVLVIVGILLGAVALNVTPGERQLLQNEAQRVALLLQLARDEAIVRNRPIAFEADDYRYRFLVRQGEGWQPLGGDGLLREREFRSAPLALTLTPATSDQRPLRIVFGKEPVDKAFALRLSLGPQAATIRADGIGNFTVE